MKYKRIKGLLAITLALNVGVNTIVPIKYAFGEPKPINNISEEVKIAQNLIKNNGFEENVVGGVIPSWKVWNGGANYVGIDTENMYEGNKCAYIVPESSIAQNLTNLKPNTSYKYTAKVKLDNEGAYSVLGVKNYGGAELKETVSGTEYKEYTITFTTGNQTSAEVYLWDGSGLGVNNKAYIDNVSVEEIPYTGESQVKLNVSKLQISRNETYQLSSKIIPESSKDKEIIYTSSDESVATVDANGNITGVSEGKVDISASIKDEESIAKCAVTVTENKQPWYSGQETNWSLTMEDDFEGDSLDTSLWTVRGKEYAAYHRSDMVKVEDGKLKLSIEKEPDGQVVLGRVDTHDSDVSVNKAKFDQKYGYFEASAKIPPTEQTYFAFWMFNYPGVFNADGTGREGTEIDITETVFQGDSTESTLHWDGYEQWHKSTSSHRKPAPNIHDGFHRYGLEWDEESLKFYFDGELTWTYKGPAVPMVKEILIFSSGLGMWGEGDINKAELPYVAEVDWVRVYTKDGYEDRVDTTKPMFYGTQNLKVEKDSEDYDLLGDVWAIDNKDDEKEITKKITVDDSDLNVNEAGVYTVTYEVTDNAGNTSKKDVDVQVVDEAEVENKVYNGTFDVENLDAWSNNSYGNLDPNKAGIVKEEENSYSFIAPNYEMQQFINLEPGKTYKLSVRAKGENAGDKVTIGLDGMNRSISGNEWKEESIIFTNKSNRSGIFAKTAGNSGKVFIDDFKLEEIENDDKTAPVITGIEDKVIKVGEKFDPKAGVSATDNKDGNLTRILDVKGNVDINTPGTYVLTYKVQDSTGNVTTAIRNIIVYDGNMVGMNSVPTISGTENSQIKVGEKFDSLKGITATDKEDGDITTSIKVDGEVNVSSVGEYTIVYTVSDSEGAIARVERVITVIENDEINKEKLKALVTEVEALRKQDYTPHSYKPVKKALKESNKVINDKNASTKEIEKAYNDLKKAYDNLELRN